MAKKRKGHSRARRFARKVRAKAAKPSLAIAGGLGVPALEVVLGGKAGQRPGLPQNVGELMNRFKEVYLGKQVQGSSAWSIQSAVTSDGVKAGVIGFTVHYIANITGANRYLARMKAPIRI